MGVDRIDWRGPPTSPPPEAPPPPPWPPKKIAGGAIDPCPGRTIEQLRAEVATLRQYRKRAKRAYRTLQAAHERVSGAYADLYRAHLDLWT
jgi:hypothetical protein